ncbi:4-hydroxy-3-methylbut-2-en-1-yl diphosphate synthase [Candidatus Fermentibacteria bacterium]|nr:MAG: 4-hydroxy-3-methylbut-2-en-1-yl diphosphate synthase [Candidatus Fermentibacteria bacterium]
MASENSVRVGNLTMGGGAPVLVQSMTTTPTSDSRATLSQINSLAELGAEIVRVSVPDDSAASALPAIVSGSPVPVVADIHFRADLAVKAIEAGIHKLRLNPGNIRRESEVREIASLAGDRNIPIRIGVNSGSVPGDLRASCGGVNENSMWKAAKRHFQLLEDAGFSQIVLSLKASDPMLTVRVNRLAAENCPYPLHLGVTEAGPVDTAGIRSAVAMGILLNEGIGDTIRISISGSPLPEPGAAWEILTSLGLRQRFPKIVSCPTCARARLDVATLAEQVRKMTRKIVSDSVIAVMGCEVNGPGEAGEADLAVIGTPSGLVLWKDGKLAGKIDEKNLNKLLSEQTALLERRKKSE